MRIPAPLPLVSLLGLAAISWWLAERDRDGGSGAQPAAGAGQPGYYLRQALLEQTDDTGRIALRVAAEKATQDPVRAEVALERLRIDYAPQPERSWRATAASGSLADQGRRVRLEGDVRLEGSTTVGAAEQPAVIYTEHLLLDTVEQRASTADPVRIELAPHAVTARGLRADLKHGTLRLEAAVNGSFAR